MKTEFIEEFVVLADTGNFLEAAERLYIAQSSLSRHIRAMEQELGEPLFERTTRHVALSEFGRIFLPYAREIAALQAGYRQALGRYRSALGGMLAVGLVPAVARYPVTDMLMAFGRENPGVKLNLVEEDSNILSQRLLSGQLDLAFLREGEAKAAGLKRIPLYRDSLCALLPPGHPLAGEKALRLEQLRDEAFLLLPQGTLVHALSLEACRRAGFAPRIAYTGHRGENMARMVQGGMGVALLMRTPSMEMAGEGVAVLPIVPEVATTISLVYPGERTLSRAGKRLLDYVRGPGRAALKEALPLQEPG